MRTIGLLSNHGSDQIPTSHRDLVECPPVAALTTVMPDGYPQTSVVWCDFDGQCVRVNTMRGFAKEAIPTSHLDLLTRPICGVLTTMGGDGQPQSSLVWVDVDGACARVNTTLQRQKGRNLLANPKVSLLVVDPDNTDRFIQIRGDAELVTPTGRWSTSTRSPAATPATPPTTATSTRSRSVRGRRGSSAGSTPSASPSTRSTPEPGPKTEVISNLRSALHPVPHLVDAHGLPKSVHVHTLRHSAASFLAAAGVPASDIAAQLDHEDGGALALKVYVHPMAEGLAKAGAHRDQIVGGQARKAQWSALVRAGPVRPGVLAVEQGSNAAAFRRPFQACSRGRTDRWIATSFAILGRNRGRPSLWTSSASGSVLFAILKGPEGQPNTSPWRSATW